MTWSRVSCLLAEDSDGNALFDGRGERCSSLCRLLVGKSRVTCIEPEWSERESSGSVVDVVCSRVDLMLGVRLFPVNGDGRLDCRALELPAADSVGCRGPGS